MEKEEITKYDRKYDEMDEERACVVCQSDNPENLWFTHCCRARMHKNCFDELLLKSMELHEYPPEIKKVKFNKPESARLDLKR